MDNCDQPIPQRFETKLVSRFNPMASTSTSHGQCVWPTTDDFDQKTAQRLVKEGATLIIEDIPVGTEFGIDLNVHNIGEKFLGIKMIPSGLHFVYYSTVSKQGSVAPRTGFFRFFSSKDLIVKKWNKTNEEIEDINGNEDRLQRYRHNLSCGALDQYLGAYQYSTYADWVGLTDYITEPLFKRLNPICGQIKSVTELISISDKARKETKPETDSEGLLLMKVEPNSSINFTEIPKRFIYPSDSSASQISMHSMDASFTLEALVSKSEHINDILGELQFAFVTFLVGHVFDSFEYWKQMLKIVCMSASAVTKHTDFYLNFIRVLHFQLKQTPHDLFADIVENNNFLVVFLRNFFSNISENPSVDQTLRNRSQRFQKLLTKNFKWDFKSELEDEAPTVVHL